MSDHGFGVTHSSAYPNWRTEPRLFECLHEEFDFGLDAAATNENKLVEAYLGPDHPMVDCRDALTVEDWNLQSSFCPIFVNPPSSREEGITLGPWLEKAVDQASHYGATIVAVVPHKTSSSFWRHVRVGAVEIREIPYRVKYWVPEEELELVNAARAALGKKAIKSGDSAGFDTAVVIFRPQPGIVQPAAPRVVTWAYRAYRS